MESVPSPPLISSPWSTEGLGQGWGQSQGQGQGKSPMVRFCGFKEKTEPFLSPFRMDESQAVPIPMVIHPSHIGQKGL